MHLLRKYLWGQIVIRTAEGVAHLVDTVTHTAKIRDLDMPLPVNENVLWFEIPMSIAVAMQEHHSLDDLPDYGCHCLLI